MSSASRRHVDPLGRPSTQTPRSSAKKTPRSSTNRGGSKGQSDDGEELIVTRGLQELLDAEIQAKRTAPTGRPAKTHRSPGHAPNFVFCYLCGRQFGKASIDIHRPQCYLKRMIQWERGDPATRGPKPVDPETHEERVRAQLQAQSAMDGAPVGRGAGGTRGKNDARDIEAYNMVQMDAYNKESLSPCPNCGRTFLPDRLQVHLRSCKPGNTAKPVRAAAAAAATTPAAPAGAPPKGIASGSAKGITGGSPPAAATAPQDQPIRASGAYRLPDDADIDAVPPSSSSGTTSPAAAGASRTRRSVSTAGAAASGENTPIRASGSYAVPDGAGEDSVPPAGQRTAQPASSSASATRRVGGPRRVSVVESAAHAVDSEGDSDDVQFTEEASARVAASERRLSMSAEREALVESSTPYRPAAMAPLTSGSQDDLTDEAVPAATVLPVLPPAVVEPETGGDTDSTPAPHTTTEVDPSPAPGSAATRRAGAAAPRRSQAATAAEQDVGQADQEATTPRKKIALNNVTRFKNVESKLKQQLSQQAQASNLSPCQFCGRTFAPERVAKHESVCLERNKAAAPSARKPKAAPKRPASLGSGQPASAPAPAAKTASTSAPRFCDQCGTKLSSSGQKFCGSCGNKL